MLKNITLMAIYSSILAILFISCASKPVYKVEVKEVLIPTKCNLALPEKPKEDGTFESHKNLAIYYRKVEQIAKDCTKGNTNE